METCLLSPVGYPMSAVSSWVRGEGGGLRRERWGGSLPESTCRTCPEAHLSTTQRCSLSLSLPLSVSFSLWLFFSITFSAAVSHFTHQSLSRPPYPFTCFHFRRYETNNSHLSTYASLTVILTPHKDIEDQLRPLDPRRQFVLGTSDPSQNSNKLWRAAWKVSASVYASPVWFWFRQAVPCRSDGVISRLVY